MINSDIDKHLPAAIGIGLLLCGSLFGPVPLIQAQDSDEPTEPPAPTPQRITSFISLTLVPNAVPIVKPSEKNLTVIPNGSSGGPDEGKHEFKIEGFKSKGEHANVTVTAEGDEHTYPTEKFLILPRAAPFVKTLVGKPTSVPALDEPASADFPRLAIEVEFWFADWDSEHYDAGLDDGLYAICPSYYLYSNVSLDGAFRTGNLDGGDNFYEAELAFTIASPDEKLSYSAVYRWNRFEFSEDTDRELHSGLLRGETYIDIWPASENETKFYMVGEAGLGKFNDRGPGKNDDVDNAANTLSLEAGVRMKLDDDLSFSAGYRYRWYDLDDTQDEEMEGAVLRLKHLF